MFFLLFEILPNFDEVFIQSSIKDKLYVKKKKDYTLKKKEAKTNPTCTNYDTINQEFEIIIFIAKTQPSKPLLLNFIRTLSIWKLNLPKFTNPIF